MPDKRIEEIRKWVEERPWKLRVGDVRDLLTAYDEERVAEQDYYDTILDCDKRIKILEKELCNKKEYENEIGGEALYIPKPVWDKLQADNARLRDKAMPFVDAFYHAYPKEMKFNWKKYDRNTIIPQTRKDGRSLIVGDYRQLAEAVKGE